jgi:sugar lactone lactonase YvrE
MLAREFMVGTPAAPLHGPRGLFIVGDTLWAADAGGLHGFDRRTGAHLAFVDFAAFSPGFLNDIARGPDGALYVTDTDRSRIHRLAGGAISIALESPSLCGPNGITWDAARGRFLTASWDSGGSVHAWSPGTDVVVDVGVPGKGTFDGIEVVGDRVLVASQLDSSLQVLEGGAQRIFIRLPGEPADIGIDSRRGHVAVPMVGRNQVEIWRLPGGKPGP